MKGVWANSSININKYIWFPRLFPHKEWHNELLDDGNKLYERALTSNGYKSIEKQIIDAEKNPNKIAVVFAKSKDKLKMNLLRYVGEFKVNLSQCTKNHMVFDRVSKKTYLSEWYK